MNVLALSGSLRAASVNSAFCRAAAKLAPLPLRVTASNLGALPLFNPDLESHLPKPVQDFRSLVGRADALLVASPEYAHGVSGVMKNALDWLVGYEGTVCKPVALVNTSPRAHHAYDALREILRTMSATIIDGASIAIPLLGACTTEEAMLAAPEVCQSIQSTLAAIAAHLTDRRASDPTFPLA